jgi:hypothetical protein
MYFSPLLCPGLFIGHISIAEDAYISMRGKENDVSVALYGEKPRVPGDSGSSRADIPGGTSAIVGNLGMRASPANAEVTSTVERIVEAKVFTFHYKSAEKEISFSLPI